MTVTSHDFYAVTSIFSCELPHLWGPPAIPYLPLGVVNDEVVTVTLATVGPRGHRLLSQSQLAVRKADKPNLSKAIRILLKEGLWQLVWEDRQQQQQDEDGISGSKKPPRGLQSGAAFKGLRARHLQASHWR